MSPRIGPVSLAIALAFGPTHAAAAATGPVIDMHVHAYALDLPPGAPACPGDQPVPERTWPR